LYSRKKLFRSFACWKQFYFDENTTNAQIKAFLKMKNSSTVANCFSILKYFYKKYLVKLKKAELLYQQTVKSNVFSAIINTT